MLDSAHRGVRVPPLARWLLALIEHHTRRIRVPGTTMHVTHYLHWLNAATAI
jgi:hypothetical protein